MDVAVFSDVTNASILGNQLNDKSHLQLALELSKLRLSTVLPDSNVTFPMQLENSCRNRRSLNVTERVNVPSSEHVAEIVGRQGCKIKALRTKTNTYIKTPSRGEQPSFLITGRPSDVEQAMREIQEAADHFTQIRASRRQQRDSAAERDRSSESDLSNGRSWPPQPAGQEMSASRPGRVGLEPAGRAGPLSAPSVPGHVTAHVQVPYRVVGLVVGPKGATIKRIQQQTNTYIVTPSRDREPVFEVSGPPDCVERARQEIEAHIAARTSQMSAEADAVDLAAASLPIDTWTGPPDDADQQSEAAATGWPPQSSCLLTATDDAARHSFITGTWAAYERKNNGTASGWSTEPSPLGLAGSGHNVLSAAPGDDAPRSSSRLLSHSPGSRMPISQMVNGSSLPRAGQAESSSQPDSALQPESTLRSVYSPIADSLAASVRLNQLPVGADNSLAVLGQRSSSTGNESALLPASCLNKQHSPVRRFPSDPTSCGLELAPGLELAGQSAVYMLGAGGPGSLAGLQVPNTMTPNTMALAGYGPAGYGPTGYGPAQTGCGQTGLLNGPAMWHFDSYRTFSSGVSSLGTPSPGLDENLSLSSSAGAKQLESAEPGRGCPVCHETECTDLMTLACGHRICQPCARETPNACPVCIDFDGLK